MPCLLLGAMLTISELSPSRLKVDSCLLIGSLLQAFREVAATPSEPLGELGQGRDGYYFFTRG